MRLGLVRAALLVAALASVMELGACTRRTQTAAPPSPNMPVGIVHQVQMTPTNAYDPSEIRIRVGDAVEWRNVAPFAQTVTLSRAASPLLVALPTGAAEFDSGRVPPGGTYRHQFIVAGRYQYISTASPGVDMVGTVLVFDR